MGLLQSHRIESIPSLWAAAPTNLLKALTQRTMDDMQFKDLADSMQRRYNIVVPSELKCRNIRALSALLQVDDAVPHALRALSGVQARRFADAAYSHVPPGRNHLAVPGEQDNLRDVSSNLPCMGSHFSPNGPKRGCGWPATVCAHKHRRWLITGQLEPFTS